MKKQVNLFLKVEVILKFHVQIKDIIYFDCNI